MQAILSWKIFRKGFQICCRRKYLLVKKYVCVQQEISIENVTLNKYPKLSYIRKNPPGLTKTLPWPLFPTARNYFYLPSSAKSQAQGGLR